MYFSVNTSYKKRYENKSRIKIMQTYLCRSTCVCDGGKFPASDECSS